MTAPLTDLVVLTTNHSVDQLINHIYGPGDPSGVWTVSLNCVRVCVIAANLPEPKGALLGSMDKNSDEFKRAAGEAVRTIPGREHGGNCDIKNLTKGCKVSPAYYALYLRSQR